MLYRQGDIILKTIKKIPESVVKKNLIIAEGEATGHMHRFIDTINVSIYELNQQQYIKIINDSDLIHNEHKTLTIKKGFYKVIHQREVDLTNEIQKVMD